jgi:hypothetical protein
MNDYKAGQVYAWNTSNNDTYLIFHIIKTKPLKEDNSIFEIQANYLYYESVNPVNKENYLIGNRFRFKSNDPTYDTATLIHEAYPLLEIPKEVEDKCGKIMSDFLDNYNETSKNLYVGYREKSDDMHHDIIEFCIYFAHELYGWTVTWNPMYKYNDVVCKYIALNMAYRDYYQDKKERYIWKHHTEYQPTDLEKQFEYFPKILRDCQIH